MFLKCCISILLVLQISLLSASILNDSNQVSAFTSGMFLKQGQVEFKLFNNMYTETFPQEFNTSRNTFLSTFIQFTIGTNRNFTWGIDAIYQSNSLNHTNSPLTVFEFKNGKEVSQISGKDNITTAQHGLSHLGFRYRIKPFKNKHFTFQNSLYVPTGLVNKGLIITADIFYERIFSNRLLYFGDLGVFYNLANAPFPYLKNFVGTLLNKHFAPYVLISLPYELGVGLKYFLTPRIEFEALYTAWLPIPSIVGEKSPHTFNIGIRIDNFSVMRR